MKPLRPTEKPRGWWGAGWVAGCVMVSIGSASPQSDLELGITHLRHPDPRMRKEAAILLGRMKSVEAVPFLIQALGDEEGPVRSEAREALRSMGPPVVPLLAAALKDPRIKDSDIRRLLVVAIGQADGNALEPLLDALRDPEQIVRLKALEMLAANRLPQALPWLTLALADPDGSIRQATPDAMVAFGPDSVPYLFGALAHREAPVRANAVHAIGPFQLSGVFTRLTLALQDPERPVRFQAVLALGYHGAAASPALAAALQLSDAGMRKAAVNALGRTRDMRNLTLITLALRDPDLNVGSEVPGALAAMGQDTLPILIDLVRHPQLAFNAMAQAALGSVDHAALLPALTQAYSNERDPLIRVRFVEASGRAQSDALPFLLGAMNDPDTSVCVAAVRSLGNVGPQASPVMDTLVRALEDPRPALRWSAAVALGRVGDAECVPAISRALLKETDPTARWEMIGVIGQFPGKEGAKALAACLDHPDAKVDQRVMDRLRPMGVDAVPGLLKAVGNPSGSIRLQALEALYEIPGTLDAEAFPILVQAVEIRDRNLLRAAIRVMGKVRHAGAVAVLEKFLTHPDPGVLEAARQALVDQGKVESGIIKPR